MVARKITKFNLLCTIWRTLFIQSVWNFERMLNLGFCYGMLPAIRRLYRSTSQRAKALVRHLEFFNTHPYMAGPIIGMVIAKEEGYAHKKGIGEEEIRRLKRSTMGPLAALGDSLFWETIHPFCALIGVAFVLLSRGDWRIGILGPIAFLVFYNVPHLYTRYMGVTRGYRLAEGIVDQIKGVNFEGIVLNLRRVGLVLLGALAALLFKADPLFGGFSPWQGLVLQLTLLAFMALLVWLLRRISATNIFFLILIFGLILGWAGFTSQ